MKKLISSTKSRLPYILGVITGLIVLLSTSIILCTMRLTKHVEIQADLSSRRFRSQVQSEIEKTTKFFNLTSSSSIMYMTRDLSSSLYAGSNKLSFSDIENNVVPSLFKVLSVTPHVTQISFIGFEGLFFAYYKDEDQTFALYSNSSVHTNSSSSPNHTTYWYTKMANRDNGKLYGNVDRSFPSTVVTDSSWFQEALKGKHGSHAFLGTNWNNAQDLLFINTSSVNGNLGLVSLGFSVKELTRYYSDVDLQGGKSCLVTGDGKFLAGDSILSFDDSIKANGEPSVSCYSNGTLSTTRASHLNTEETGLIIQCSHLDILGVQSVYVMAIQKSSFIKFVHRFRTIILILFVLTIAIMIAMISSSILTIHRAVKREAYLSSTLTKQRNAAEQAERKITNKTRAFATASHDIRASLAGMIGLIEISYNEVASGSELETNLRQLEGCTKDLSSMLTSILDSSKIEAGKMLLEEEEFDVAQLFEDIVDLYHPVGAKKGIDVILDPCDVSVSKFSRVKCDRIKLRQILCNLISNAVKFTSEGQVVVRAWIRKPATKKSIEVASNQSSGLMQSLRCLFLKNKKKDENLKARKIIEENEPNSMELVCEVDDTGKGIPKEKRNEVFENYVQVKETALGQGGTGLGLGIVQSLVRLMHGEIGIMDKDKGETKGSCFRFNISLTTCDNVSASSEENSNENNVLMSSSPHVLTQSPSCQEQGSYVVLLIRNDERRRLSAKLMESLGIKVFSLNCPDQLPHAFKRIQRKWNCSSDCFSLEIESQNSSHDVVDDCVPFSRTVNGEDYLSSLFKKTDYHCHPRGTSLGFVLLVVDANAGTFSELCDAVNESRNSLESAYCRVVWLANHMSQSGKFEGKIMFDSDDMIVKHKPLHGSRLYEIVRLLPEFGGQIPKGKSPSKSDGAKPSQSEIQEVGSSSNKEKPLSGKKILVVDDTLLQRKIAMHTIEKLGGTVELCSNGLEAFELVRNGLSNSKKQGNSMISGLPYFDYILMDCEMPVMNGYDATGEIREVEKLHGVHTPIIALTAHTPGSEEANRTFAAGMDAFLCRPLNKNDLIDVINNIN